MLSVLLEHRGACCFCFHLFVGVLSSLLRFFDTPYERRSKDYKHFVLLFSVLLLTLPFFVAFFPFCVRLLFVCILLTNK